MIERDNEMHVICESGDVISEIFKQHPPTHLNLEKFDIFEAPQNIRDILDFGVFGDKIFSRMG